MNIDANTLKATVEEHRERLLRTLEDLIALPSENRSPNGAESACQQYLAEQLTHAGYAVDLYTPDSVPSLADHPLRTPGRHYADRPNLAVKRQGSGGGRSLLLSGHIDTVPVGTLPWTRQPLRAKRDGNRIYGRGANDMKAGIAINLFILQVLDDLGLTLCGDLLFESVVDEEFGGVNGTLAARLRGPLPDAAVLTEPSSLRICAGQRGGRTVHLLFSAKGGVLNGSAGAGVIAQVSHFLNALPTFAAQRKQGCAVHPLYAACEDPVPVTVTKMTTGPWGTAEPITVPEECRVELYWQLMPGELEDDVNEDFQAWLQQLVTGAPDIYAQPPAVTTAVRWLPGSAWPADARLCVELAAAAEQVTATLPVIVGIEGPCDLFVFHQFGIPAVLWGPRGGNTHGSDEYVEIDSMLRAAAALLLFVCRWCGVAA
ncbi:MAG: M20/M25/M40 family metallo-hydrolase [Janthinobacterium lividum]